MSDYNKAVAAMGRLNDLMGEHVPEHARTDRAADDIWTMFSIIEDHKRKSEELTAARDEAEKLRARVSELECMVKVFRGCIETGLHPNKGSPCHAKVIGLVGQQTDEPDQ